MMQTRFLHRFLGLVVVSVGLLGGGCHRDITDKDIITLAPSEVNRRLTKECLVLDMRDQDRYDNGHLPFARLGRLADVPENSDTPKYPGYPLIVVYGQNPGSAAAKAMAKRLMINRNSNVRWMEAGFDEWLRLGLPVDLSITPGN